MLPGSRSSASTSISTRSLDRRLNSCRIVAVGSCFEGRRSFPIHRQEHFEDRSTRSRPGRGTKSDGAAVPEDQRPGHPQSQARSLQLLGRKERIVHLFLNACRYPGSFVVNGDARTFFPGAMRRAHSNRHLRTRWRCLGGISQEIAEHLGQLPGESLNGRQSVAGPG